jgi:DHA2 family multidrug resistance protein
VYNPVFNQAVQQLGALGMTQQQTYGAVNQSILQQAAQLGVNDLYASAGIVVLLIALIWVAKPERAGPDAAASAAH